LTVPQLAVVAFLLVSIILIATLLIRTGIGRSTLPQGERSWLDYGNLYVAALGIAAVIIGFLVILLFLDHFADGTQALGFLTALFGAIVGLVGTYFGVKQSADAREGAESATTLAAGVGSKVPTVTITPANTTVGRGANHTVTATVISVDGSPAAGIPVTFTVTAGPDATTTSTELTDASGQARFTFTNNGTAGNDTIEATALEGKGTATVTFT
jgi:Big-like domain-containing protein